MAECSPRKIGRFPVGALLGLGLLVGIGAAQPPARLPFQTQEPPMADPAPAPDGDVKPAAHAAISPIPPVRPAYNNDPRFLQPNGPVGDPPTPFVSVRVRVPATVAVGQEVTYRIRVENRSQAPAHHVLLRNPLPAAADFVKATPPPTEQAPELLWKFGTLEPGAFKDVVLVLKAKDGKSEIRSCARVQFEHGECVTTQVAKPELTVKKSGPAQGVLHDALSYRIEVFNPGKVEVADVQVTDSLGDGLEYLNDLPKPGQPQPVPGTAKNQRAWRLGTLRPGERKVIEFQAIAKGLGKLRSQTVATGPGGVHSVSESETTISEAKLGLRVTGPEAGRALVNQAAFYQIVVNNMGSAVLNNVRVSCTLPPGTRPAKVSNDGQLFRDQVQWVLPRMAPGDSRSLTLGLLAQEAGPRALKIEVRGDRGLAQSAEVKTDFQGLPKLDWRINGSPSAGAGQEVRYEVTVTNAGSGPATNVQLKVDLPAEVEFAQKGTPRFSFADRAVVFQPLDLRPQQSATFTFSAVAKQKGEAHFRFEMVADHLRSGGPVHLEKTTVISGN